MDFTSAGTILVSFKDRKVLLIKHPEGHWGFSKGFIEKGENAFVAAKRELLEEVGISCNFYMNPKQYNFEESYAYVDNNGKTIEKRVIYYIGITCNTDYILEKALKDCRWFELSELYSLPNFKSVQIVNQIEGLINKEIAWVNNGEKNDYFEENNLMSSKHTFSRVIPLLEYSSKVRILNAPNIMDSYFMYEIIKKSKALKNFPMILHEEDVNNCWSSVNILPFLIYNHKTVTLKTKPCGCRIGKRSIDLYLKIMQEFGIQIKNLEDGSIVMEYNQCNKDLIVNLPFPSFTGTSMAIYCAMLNNKKTHIENISLEPEIIFLIDIVKQMGWDINLEGRDLFIEKTNLEINEVDIEIPVDRNVLITRIVDCLINNEEFYYESKHGLYLSSLIKYFDEIGVKYKYDHKSIYIYENQLGKLKSIPIICGHFPLLCSDWQPMLALLSLLNSKELIVKDNVFENRYGYFKQIASVYQDGKEEIKDGVFYASIDNKIKTEIPYNFDCLDIRASAVLFMLLENNFKACIKNITQLLRGYSNVSQISPRADKLGYFEFV